MIESTARAERVNLQSYSSPAYTWEAPGKPVCVRIPFTVIDRLEKEVVDNFRSLTSRGSEIGGILLGAAAVGNPTVVSIDDYEVISCDYSRGPLYRLSDADMGRFERSIEQRLSGGGFGVVGFFRSHTRKGLSLDAEDLAFFSARFRDASNVALLVRPFATKASTAGFFIWESGAVQGETSYLEFPFRSSQLSSARPNGPVAEPAPAVNPAVGSAAAAPPAPAAPKPQVRAQIVPIASRREISLPVPPEPTDSQSAPKQVEQKAAQPKPVEQKPVESKPAAPPEPVAAAPAPVPAAAAPVAAAPVVAAPPAAPAPAKEVEKPKEKAAAPAPAPAKEAEKPKEKAAAAPVKEQEKEKAKDKPVEKLIEKAKEPAKVVEKPIEKPVEKAFEDLGAETKGSGKGKAIVIGSALLAAIAAGTILFVYPGVLNHKGRDNAAASLDASNLSLRVERTGTDILLTWNRDALAIQRASHAVLTISDGERHENYDMDMGQLRNGSIVYSPLTADVSFKMEVTGKDNSKVASESVRVLRTRPSPMPDGSQPPPVDTAAANNNKTPGKPNTPATPTAAAEEPTAQEAPAPSKPVTPTKAFNTASLAQRLRPATPSEAPLPDAPMLNNSPVVSGSAPTFGANPLVPAPVAPAPVAPAPVAERKAPVPTPAPTSASTGGQIQQAQVIFSKQPEYPKLARQMGVKGSVEVLASIGTDGHVKSVKVVKGHPLLVKAATEAVMQWIYKPTLLNGTPVQNDTHITLNFAGDR
jgi:TonB family protein